MSCAKPMLDRRTLKLAVQYTALFLSSMAILTLGILLYMNAATGGDYFKDLGLGGAAKISDAQAQGTAEAVQDRLERGLMLINGLLIVVIPIVSYRMARAAIKPIQASLEAQQQFVDNASHELGTPLSVISGELQLVVSRQRPAKEYEAAIRSSLAEVQNLANLTKNLTLLARSDRQAVRRGFGPVDLEPLIRNCLVLAERSAAANGVEIRFAGPKKAMVQGDASLLRTAVYNLIDNAIKYSPQGAEAAVRLKRDGQAWTITVSDRGPGMGAAELPLATRRFWRSDSARDRYGRGLGLSIADQIVTLHHGSLNLENGVREGLVATVRLPSANT